MKNETRMIWVVLWRDGDEWFTVGGDVTFNDEAAAQVLASTESKYSGIHHIVRSVEVPK